MSHIEASGLLRRIRQMRDGLAGGVEATIDAEMANMQEIAVGLVPKRTGNLADLLAREDAIEKIVEEGKIRWRFGFLSDHAKRKGWYWRFVEFGTASYEAGSLRNAGVDRYGRQRMRRIKRYVPARKAQSFMRPSLIIFKERMRGMRLKSFLSGARGAPWRR